MISDRWHEADAIFSAALALAERERRGFVMRATRDDDELRVLVEELLDAESQAGSFMEASVEDYCDVPWQQIFAATVAPREQDNEAQAADRTGERVGPYRLLRRIGLGGMADVYLAERADGQFEQHVAIKLIRRGIDSDDAIRRFIAERQILSSLAHPNIARLLDGGAAHDGLPYLVMEFVEGKPLMDYCDERRLNVRQRLRLFCDVGRAVQHAHRTLVVHRDLKPSNILVDADGRVKLLDFGIAKLIADDPGADATRVGTLALTPAYASPEQIRGDPITTASDVYQLGLLLCELLTRRLPYEVGALSPARAEREITETEPKRLTTLISEETAAALSTSSRELMRTLRGDLETIVQQSLRKEPEARYASAEAFVDDIERFMNSQPVRARPDTVGYRVRKFVSRHRAPVVAACAVVVVLAGAAVTASVQARRLAVERDRAVAQEARATRVTEFLTSLFRVADPNEARGKPVDAVELLDHAHQRALTELESDPQAQAEVLSAIGMMYVNRGLRRAAIAPLERAVAIRRELGSDPARLVSDLRGLSTAVWYRDRERAMRLTREAVALAERELGPNHALLAAALTDLAERSSGPEAEGAIERALTILRAQTGDVRAELAQALTLAGRGHGLAGLPKLREALALQRSLYGEEHTATAATLSDIALMIEPFDPVAADTILERAAAINARIHGPDHFQTLTIMNNLAGRYRDRGDFSKAKALYREVLRRRRAAYPTDSTGHAFVMHGLGWSLTELGRPEEAEPLLRDVVRLVRPDTGDTNGTHQMALSTLGRNLAAQRRFSEAEPLLRESYEWVSRQAPTSIFIPFMLDRLVRLYDDWGRPALADGYRARRMEWQRTIDSAADAVDSD